jgi:hypothetical protein
VLPLRKQLHRATVKGKLHSCESRVRENAVHAVGIEDFQTQISARRHDFRGACGLNIDRVAILFPRRDGASLSFTSDVISICNKAATELFGKWSEADFIAFFTKTLPHWSTPVAQAPFKSKACACEVSRRPPQNRRKYSPVDRLTLNIARLPRNAKIFTWVFARNSVSHSGFWRKGFTTGSPQALLRQGLRGMKRRRRSVRKRNRQRLMAHAKRLRR